MQPGKSRYVYVIFLHELGRSGKNYVWRLVHSSNDADEVRRIYDDLVLDEDVFINKALVRRDGGENVLLDIDGFHKKDETTLAARSQTFHVQPPKSTRP